MDPIRLSREDWIIMFKSHEGWLNGSGCKVRVAFEDIALASFNDLNLAMAEFFHCKFNHTQFHQMNLMGTDFRQSDMRFTLFRDVNLHSADFSQCDLTGAAFHNVNLTGASFACANLSKVVFGDQCILRNVDFRSTDLTRTDFRRVDLQGVDLDYASFPLWCGTKWLKVERKIAAQLAAHFCSLDCKDPEYIEARKAILEFAKTSHVAKYLGLDKP